MKTTLFIEISEITARILVYNEVDQLCHYVDVTGGYGKKSIPLDIHYLKEGEILIGEDAMIYDEEEDSTLINSILYAKENVAIDYISVLKNKVEHLIPQLVIGNIIIISKQKLFKTDEFLSLFKSKFNHVTVKLISVEEAVAGWFYNKTNDNQDNTTVAYLDYKELSSYTLKVHKKTNTILVEVNVFKLDLNAIHEFYMNALLKSHNIEGYNFTSHQLKQLYNSQKATLHKQLIGNKDVNVYSSLFFPPRKIVLPYKSFKKFKDNWYEQHSRDGGISKLKQLEIVDKLVLSGGYDLVQFLNCFETFDLPNHDYKEYIVLDGGFSFYKNLLLGNDIIFKQSLNFSIGVFNDQEFYPIIKENEKFSKHYEVELILTDFQEELQLFSKANQHIIPIYKLSIRDPKKIQRILLKINLNENKEIDEVSYELRRL